MILHLVDDGGLFRVLVESEVSAYHLIAVVELHLAVAAQYEEQADQTSNRSSEEEDAHEGNGVIHRLICYWKRKSGIIKT